MVRKEVRVESYSGYKEGETPRRIFLRGKEYPVEYIIYRYKQYDLEREEYADVFKLSLENYGECEIFYKHKLDAWEIEEPDEEEEPEKSFAQEALEENKE